MKQVEIFEEYFGKEIQEMKQFLLQRLNNIVENLGENGLKC